MWLSESRSRPSVVDDDPYFLIIIDSSQLFWIDSISIG